MAVGQKLRPHPSQSYPRPEQFKEWPWVSEYREKGEVKNLHKNVRITTI